MAVMVVGSVLGGRGRRPRWLTGMLLATVLTAAAALSAPAQGGKEMRYRYAVNGGMGLAWAAQGPMRTLTGDDWALTPIRLQVKRPHFTVTVDDDALTSPALRPLYLVEHRQDGTAVRMQRLCVGDGQPHAVALHAETAVAHLEVRNHETTQYGGWCFGAFATTGLLKIRL